jgi:hypothetical protein
MAVAAKSPVGPGRVTTATKCRDILIVVAAPFIVPAVLLALARSGPGISFFGSFTLGDVAFGFVSMAIAGVARATTSKSDEWMAFSIGAMIVVALQTTLAIHVDTVPETKLLVSGVFSTSPVKIAHDLPDLKEVATSIQNADPMALSWAASLLSGSLIAVVSFELIRRER